MKKFLSCTIIFILGMAAVYGQKQVLMTIDNQPVYKSEFEHIYKKNLKLIHKNKEDVDDYLQRFINYKLKVLEAEARGLDTTKSFLAQLHKYKGELAQKYMMNTKVSDHLLHQAYKRLHTVVNASHIMIRLPKTPTPSDTLKAYKKIKKIQRKLKEGASFEQLALDYSEDPSVKSNHGDLGWFGVFKMVYPFENAAYRTEPGQVSNIVRTQFGYHLVKVNARRKSVGKVKVAQILIKFHRDSTDFDAKKRIEKIYQKLKAGAAFSDMAKQYSDDKTSAFQGGALRPFKPYNLRSKKIRKAVLGLTPAAPLSKPFETQQGWRILKLLKRIPIPDFENDKKQLRTLIKRSGRSRVIRDHLIKKLKQQYTIREMTPGLDYFKAYLGDSLLKKAAKNLPHTAMIKIKKDSMGYDKFLKTLRIYKRFHKKRSFTAEVLNTLFEKFKGNQLFAYQQRHLSEINAKYAHIIKDYHDGLLIYALMNNNIWQKAKDDSLGLQSYFAAHQADFKIPKKYDAEILSGSDQHNMEVVRQMMKKGAQVKQIKSMYPKIMSTLGKFTVQDPRLPNHYPQQPGLSKVQAHHGVFVLVRVKRIIPAKNPPLNAVRGKVINAYQKKLKKAFLAELHQKYKVKIRRRTLRHLKKEFE